MRAMRRAAFGGNEDEGVRGLQDGAVLQPAVPSGGLGGPQGPVPLLQQKQQQQRE